MTTVIFINFHHSMSCGSTATKEIKDERLFILLYNCFHTFYDCI